MARRVLVVGNGGREHALAWKLAQSAEVERVYCAPGNGGTAREPKVENLPIAATDVDGLLAAARDLRIDLTVVGPEAPLVVGLADRFRRAGLAVFGPGAAGARLEGSKAFAKEFMVRHGLPTAAYRRFADFDAARAYLKTHPLPVVVKADGLASGKGVVVAGSREEALEAAERWLQVGPIVMEEFLEGEEASYIALVVDGQVVPLASSQDHKRLLDGDQGPNTGGMGAYSPAPVLDTAMSERVLREVMRPAAQALLAERIPYRGFLYAGLMITRQGPKVLEFNCRLGDPETQPLLMRLRSDLFGLLHAAALGEPLPPSLQWDERTALGVVLAAAGYPDAPRQGDLITGLDGLDDAALKVFHAGTLLRGEQVYGAGGRVLTVTALGSGIGQARSRAYEAAARIHWTGMQFRRDIGHRALHRP